MGTDLAERSETAGRLRGFGGGATRVRRAALRQRFLAVLVLWVAIFVYFSLTQSRFFTSANLDALMTSAAVPVVFLPAVGFKTPIHVKANAIAQPRTGIVSAGP